MPSPSTAAASPLFLREEEVRHGYELLHYGHAALHRALDPALAAAGIGRAHQRALYAVARQPGLTVGALMRRLGVTKQSLARVLADLVARDLVTVAQGRDDRRQRVVRATPRGQALDAALFATLRDGLRAAYAGAGQQAVTGFWHVLEGLQPR